MTFLLKHAQKSKFGDKLSNHFRLFIFIIFFFFAFPFSLLHTFLLQLLAFYQVSLSSRISKKALIRQEILAMDKQRAERGNFPLSFLLKFQNVLVHILSSINPIGLV